MKKEDQKNIRNAIAKAGKVNEKIQDKEEDRVLAHNK